jgi:hypothetical protein
MKEVKDLYNENCKSKKALEDGRSSHDHGFEETIL